MRASRRWNLLVGGALAVLTAAVPFAQQRRGPGGQGPEPLQFRFLGPAVGNRVASIAGVPGDTLTYYAGAASGGIWKTTDGGLRWTPVADLIGVAAIGALAVAPSDPKIVYAGTGEAWAIRDIDVAGDGVYKSTDAGATWTHTPGLEATGRIGRVLVHPTNPNIAFACAVGRMTGPQRERGVFRTTDGGQHWEQVLFVDENTGCSGLTMDAHNPNVLFAGTWQVEMHTWAMFSGGPGSGIYVSRDGGTTWKKVESPGLPKPPVGKIDVAVAPSDSNRVYALIQTKDQGSLWRSDDGGQAWRNVNWQRGLIGRAGYYIHLAVSPGNPDEVMVANSSFWVSTDGGQNFTTRPWGGDTHDIWWDSGNADRFAITDDGGLTIATQHGRITNRITLPIGQNYHVAVDNQVPYWVYSNMQDDGTMRGPSTAPEGGAGGRGGRGGGRGAADSTGRGGRSGRGAGRGGRGAPARDTAARVIAAGAPRGRGGLGARPDTASADSAAGGGRGGVSLFGGSSTWDHGLGGCESGFTLPDPTDPNIVWASCYGNEVTRYDHTVKRARSVSPWIHTLDSPPNTLKYRCHWTPPLAIDPFDHNTVYYGCQVVFKTSNGGQSWSVISPDLSTRDSTRIVSSGGIVEDNLGQFYGEVVFAIAPSEIQRGLIWAGTNDGQLWYTRDGGTNWTNVTKNMAGLPAWGTIRKIEPSHFDAATAYVAIDVHMMDDRKPYIYKTTDFGQTWTNITSDLPASHPLDYVMAVTENPNRKGMLFAGTGHGFYYSLDDGSHWTQFKAGLPQTAVSWIVVPKLWHDVVVSTYGRGIFILKDIAPLERAGEIADADVVLYPPHPGYRQARTGRADVTFALKQSSPRPARVEILDSAGTVVRTLQSPTRAGYNRVVWDLRYDLPHVVALRTPAPDNPHIFEEPRFRNRPTRPITHWGIQGAQTGGPLAVPGRYTVRVTVNGTTETQPLVVLKDPEITTSDADLAASTQAQVRVRNGLTASADLVNRLEVMRKQIIDQQRANAEKPDVVSALKDLDARMMNVELMLVSRSDLESDDKYYVEPFKVYMAFIWLNGVVGTGAGDVAGGADYPPTESALEWLGSLEKDLAAAKAAYKTLVETDLTSFNKSMDGKIPAITETVRPVVP